MEDHSFQTVPEHPANVTTDGWRASRAMTLDSCEHRTNNYLEKLEPPLRVTLWIRNSQKTAHCLSVPEHDGFCKATGIGCGRAVCLWTEPCRD